MKSKIIIATYLILILCAQPLCAQEKQIQPTQTEQKASEKKSWWTSTKKKIVFGLSAIGTAAVIVIGGWKYHVKEQERKQELTDDLYWDVVRGNPDYQKIEMMLKAGADPNWKNWRDNDWTALSHAAYYGKDDVIKILLKHGADPNIGNQDSVTALSLAVYHNHPSTVRLLLDAGAKPNEATLRGELNLLYYAKHPSKDYGLDPSIIDMLKGAGAKE